MARHLFAWSALAALAAGCGSMTPAGWSPGGGGAVGPGGGGGAGGNHGGAGSGGGAPGGSGGTIEEPACPDPENEPLCWALGEGAWTTAPGVDFVPEVAIVASAKPEQLSGDGARLDGVRAGLHAGLDGAVGPGRRTHLGELVGRL